MQHNNMLLSAKFMIAGFLLLGLPAAAFSQRGRKMEACASDAITEAVEWDNPGNLRLPIEPKKENGIIVLSAVRNHEDHTAYGPTVKIDDVNITITYLDKYISPDTAIEFRFAKTGFGHVTKKIPEALRGSTTIPQAIYNHIKRCLNPMYKY